MAKLKLDHHARARREETARTTMPRSRVHDVGAEPAKVKRQSKHRREYNISHTRPRHPLVKNYWGDT